MKKAWINEMVAARKKDFSHADLRALKKQLTIKVKDFDGSTEAEVFIENEHWFWMPRRFGYKALKTRGFVFKDQRTMGPDIPFEVNWDILDQPPYPPDQSILVKTVVSKAKRNGFGGFAVAPTASGKTLMCSYIGAQLGGKTLIVVHKSDLIKNWRESIREHIKIKGNRPLIGKIQGPHCEYGHNYSFSIAMVQSLVQKEYPPEMFAAFRTVIFDECHHIPADTFLSALYRFKAKYLIGTTATLRRKDGTEKVFTHAIGDVLYTMVRQGVEGRVYFQKVPFLISGKKLQAGGRVSPSKVGTAFENLEYRNVQIVEQLVKAYKAGRKILVLANTRDHLAYLFEMLPPIIRKRSGFYVGGRKEAELERVAQKQILLGTYGMAYEGMDVPELDMLALATPVKDIEQPAGRILRKHEFKMKPLILDFVDDQITLRKWAHERARYYRREGFEIKTEIPA